MTDSESVESSFAWIKVHFSHFQERFASVSWREKVIFSFKHVPIHWFHTSSLFRLFYKHSPLFDMDISLLKSSHSHHSHKESAACLNWNVDVFCVTGWKICLLTCSLLLCVCVSSIMHWLPVLTFQNKGISNKRPNHLQLFAVDHGINSTFLWDQSACVWLNPPEKHVCCWLHLWS